MPRAFALGGPGLRCGRSRCGLCCDERIQTSLKPVQDENVLLHLLSGEVTIEVSQQTLVPTNLVAELLLLRPRLARPTDVDIDPMLVQQGPTSSKPLFERLCHTAPPVNGADGQGVHSPTVTHNTERNIDH